MLFRNRLAQDVTFEAGGVQYVCPASGTVAVPDQFAFAIQLMGLPLDDAALEEATRPEPPKADKPDAKVAEAPEMKADKPDAKAGQQAKR